MNELLSLVNLLYYNQSVIQEMYASEIETVIKCFSEAIYNNEVNEEALVRSYHILILLINSEKITIKERWAIFDFVWRQLFIKPVLQTEKMYVIDAYYNLVGDFDVLLKKAETICCIPQFVNVKKGCVVIFTDQFLSVKHAPSIRLLDYAYTLKKYYVDEVVIINSAMTHYYPPDYLSCGYLMSFMDTYSPITSLGYNELEFPFYQTECIMPEISEMAMLVATVRFMEPSMVIGLGQCNVVADLCRGFSKTINMPCTTEIPVSTSNYLILHREIEERDNELLKYLGKKQMVIPVGYFNYILHDQICENLDAAIKTDAFNLAVVGNRLDDEIDKEFLNMLDTFLAIYQDAYVYFVGSYLHKMNIECLSNSNRFVLLGQRDDVCSVLKQMNVYVQPNRRGGGRSAFESMKMGIPIITTDFGDTKYVSHSAFVVDDYNAMLGRLELYHDDVEEYNKAKGYAISRASELSDIREMFARIFDYVNL